MKEIYMKIFHPAFSFKSAILASVLVFAPAHLQASQNQHSRNSTNDRIEVAFVIDTTGSMANLIEGAKRKIWSIANTIIDINPNADIRMALVAYRDYGDQYVVKKYQMSTDIQGLYGNLIRFRADGGGDTPEAVNEALHASINDLNWSPNDDTTRLVFLVGDAPPHMDYDNGPKYPQIIRSARNAGIVIHTVQAGNSTRTRHIWSEIASLSGGSYIPIPQDGGQIAIIDTPYDEEILQLQKRIDKTVIPYGNDQMRSGLAKKLAEKSNVARSVIIENSKFYSKRKKRKEVVTGGGDIIGAIVNQDISLDDINQSALPAPIQKLSKSEQRALFARKLAERKDLQNEMARLVKKHDAFTKVERKKLADKDGKFAENSFDRAVSSAIKKSF